jgi:hypothetical protein
LNPDLGCFFLWNNSGLTNLRLSHAVFHVLYGPRPQDAGTPMLLAVLTSKSDPARVSAPTVQPPPKSHRPWLLQSLYPTIQCNYIACNVPPDAGLQKKTNFSTPIIGLSKPQIRATCVGRSGANLSAIQYGFKSRLLRTLQWLERSR